MTAAVLRRNREGRSNERRVEETVRLIDRDIMKQTNVYGLADGKKGKACRYIEK